MSKSNISSDDSMTASITRYGRRAATIAVLLLVVSSVSVVPAAAATDIETMGPFTPSAANAGGVLGPNVPDRAVTYGEGHPGWWVYVENGSVDSLKKWANSSDARVIQSVDHENNRVLVSAPAGAIGVSLLSRVTTSGLAFEEYVKTVGLHVRMSLPDTPDSLGESSYAVPFGRKVSLVLGPGSLNTEGVAFSNEVNATNFSRVLNTTATLEAHNQGVTGHNITIAVLDTGVNVLEGSARGKVFGNGSANSSLRIEVAYNALTDEFADIENGSYAAVSDGNGHGTWVAAAAAGANGVAPNATLQIYKVLSDDGSGTTANIIQSIEMAEKRGADVVALSLGSPVANTALAQEMKEALRGNISAFSVAVGNSRQTTRWIASPADVDRVIAVAAATNQPPSEARSAFFSNVGPDSGLDRSSFRTRGELPTLSAPGFKITLGVPTEDGSRVADVTMSGTSMAQPVVAGAIALMLDANPDMINETETILNATRNASSPAPHMGVTETGYGFLNVSNMVETEYPNTSQVESRNQPAERRDKANYTLSGWPDPKAAAAEGEGVGA